MTTENMYIALTVCMLTMLLNILAVTTGVADAVYTPLTEWLNGIFS